MIRFMILTAVLLAVSCSAPADEVVVEEEEATSVWEGTFEYLPPQKGQAINHDGRFVYLYGPLDETAPMTSDAGTYVVSNDTITATNLFSTNPELVGLVYSGAVTSVTGDTIAFKVLNESGEVTGEARAVRVR